MESGPADPTVDPRHYRRVVGHFVTGVTIVTTYDAAAERHHAMTVNSFASVSLDPVLVLFCAEKAARFHGAVLAAGRWGVSVLGADQADVSAWFATRGRPLEGQLDGYKWSTGPLTGAALFDEAIATLECRTWATYDGGDHTVILGTVLAATAAELSAPPLLFYDGDYRGLEC